MGGWILKDTPNRAREWALHTFCMGLRTNRVYIGDDRYAPIYENGEGSTYRQVTPVAGDVVLMGSAATSAQWLAVVVDVHDNGNRYADVYGLRGCGYSDVVNWTNCGLEVLNREWVKENPRFFWLEEEWAFEDKIERAHRLVGHDTDTYRKLTPNLFGEDATLSYRRKWSNFDEDGVTITLPNWRKMTLKALKLAVSQVEELFEKKKAGKSNGYTSTSI